MQYPNTPSSGRSQRSAPPQAPNAPYMRAYDLPPSPQSPIVALSGRGGPPAAPRMYPVGLPNAPGYNVSYGLMTPPTSPAKSGGVGAAPAMHPLLSSRTPIHFNLKESARSMQVSAPQEIASHPPTALLAINVIGVFHVMVSGRHGAALTVFDVLQQLVEQMSRQPTVDEKRCFPKEVQDSIDQAASSRARARGGHALVRRLDFLGPRVVFAGLEVTHVANGIVYCDLSLKA